MATNCDEKLTEDILQDCLDKAKKNLDGGKAVFINIDDIDRAASTSAGATVSDIVLSSGTSGFSVEWLKDLASVNSAFSPSDEDLDGFLHNYLARLTNATANAAERARELANGRFVVVVETKYKGTDQADAFKVLGWENGLKLSELIFNTLENSGSMLFSIGTKEGEPEDYPFQIFLETDYATSKASFDAAFATV